MNGVVFWWNFHSNMFATVQSTIFQHLGQIGKLLSEPIMPYFNDACMRHSALVSWILLEHNLDTHVSKTILKYMTTYWSVDCTL